MHLQSRNNNNHQQTGGNGSSESKNQTKGRKMLRLDNFVLWEGRGENAEKGGVVKEGQGGEQPLRRGCVMARSHLWKWSLLTDKAVKCVNRIAAAFSHGRPGPAVQGIPPALGQVSREGAEVSLERHCHLGFLPKGWEVWRHLWRCLRGMERAVKRGLALPEGSAWGLQCKKPHPWCVFVI